MRKFHAMGLVIFLLFQPGFCFAESIQTHQMSLNDFPDIKKFDYLINKPENKIDLAVIKLTIDKTIDPSIDINKNLKIIENMVSKIKTMLGSNPSSEAKVMAVKKYLYEKGNWNNYKPFHYSFDDPLGEKIENKLISNYIETRIGNCVSMPILFVILGQRLGIDVTLSTAPNHFFVKYTNDQSHITFNLEATNGANITRDIWYRKQMPMTDKAIESGIYMEKLSKKETAAVMLNILSEYYWNKNDLPHVLAVSQVILKNDKKDIETLLRISCVFYKLLKNNFLDVYIKSDLIPLEKREYFNYLAESHQYFFKKAEDLGFKEESEENKKDYLEIVKNRAVEQNNSVGGERNVIN
jgi:regulator of sirC expression with transglutaminase-like and TPR domain